MKFSLVKFKPKPKQVKGLECLNCGQPLTGNENFCSYCGQKNTIKKLSFGVFISNIFSGFFSYDSRFWRTFIPLLTKPGKVSKQYIQGKRARFVNPFQLYLNVSIIFFIILGISNRFSENKAFDDVIKIGNDSDAISQIEQVNLDTINISKTDSIAWTSVAERLIMFYKFKKQNPSFSNEQMLDSLGFEKTFWNKFYSQQAISMHKNMNSIIQDGGKEYFKKLTSYISISLFIFLPIFTLFLKLIYIRREFTYMEHLVFVFNTQTVFFLLLSIFYLLNFFVELSNFGGVIILVFLVYLYKALKYFYDQSRTKTILKYILLNSYYMFLALIGFIIVSVLSFFIS